MDFRRARRIPFPALAGLAALAIGLAGPAAAANSDHVRQLIETGACQGCDLSGAKLKGLKLTEADLTGANLSGADLRKADLRRARLAQAVLAGARLKESRLKGADLGQADLRRADLREADLRYAHLYGADFQGADLSNARLEEAVLGRTNFSGARGLSEALAAQPTWQPERRIAPPDEEPNPLARVWRYLFGS
ncbi:MAG: pentapeptide repeat-containing protein [Alphaproteobacteria bacterium]|nr:pentapeptide repeat-containing protein [Alphaproteobacteria bacterium]